MKPVRRILALGTEPWNGFGGIAQACRDYLGAMLQSEDVEAVQLLSRIQAPEQTSSESQHANFAEEASPGNPAKYIARAFEISKSFQPDLIVCLHTNLAVAAQLAASLKGCPVWLVMYGIDAWRSPGWLTSQALKGIPFATAASRYTAERYLQWADMPKSGMRVLHNAVDRERFAVEAKSPAALDRFGTHGRRVLLSVGAMRGGDRLKGHDEVIGRIQNLATAIPNFLWLVVGDGPDKARLQQRVHSERLQNWVRFAGRVDEADKLLAYSSADAFVLANQTEGFGIVLAEALASGLPCVASRLDGSADALMDGRLGRLVDPRNGFDLEIALLDALCSARRQPELLSFFDIERLNQRVERLLQEQPWLKANSEAGIPDPFEELDNSAREAAAPVAVVESSTQAQPTHEEWTQAG